MHISYCTLFDSNYLDKGIVTVNSLARNDKKAVLYILCMDSVCKRILDDYYKRSSRIRLIDLEVFLNEELRNLQKQRKRAEFCWTCVPSLLKYVFDEYQERICTYIDADMYFYSDPDILVQEMLSERKSVQIIEHRFKMNNTGRKRLKASGRFCVEFNTFVNESQGLEVLEKWKEDVIDECVMQPGRLGDQYYLKDWPDRYSCVHILKNKGAGLAGWNIDRYKLAESKRSSRLNLYVSFDNKGCHKVVFYHFHDLRYIDGRKVDIGVFKEYAGLDKKLIYSLYIPYLSEIDQTKNMLKRKYGICPLVKTYPGEERNTAGRLEKIKVLASSEHLLPEVYNLLNHKIRSLTRNYLDIIDLEKMKTGNFI